MIRDTNMPNQRKKIEQQALARFEQVACEHGYRVFKGQGMSNRIPVRGKAYFQFGDLRVDTEKLHIVIEVESAGGVTNLTKYWYCLEKRSDVVKKPIVLFHIFQQHSAGDYESHLTLWDFLWSRMNSALGEARIKATRYTYQDMRELESVVEEFKKYLSE